MIDLSFITIDLVRVSLQNFTIIATLVLLYNFIPDRFRSQPGLAFSLCVGGIFGLAAAISIPSLWQATGDPILGFNVILVPLAGFTGGPVSAAVAAIIFLLGSATVSTGSLLSTDILIVVMSGILLGALFYYGRSWKRFPTSSVIQLFLLGTGVALIESYSFVLSVAVGTSPVPLSYFSSVLSIIPFVVFSIGGTILLGSIIGFIDRKKQAETELHEYKDHLEGLVKERTAELMQANSLQKATIESTADGIVVMDRDGIILMYNQKAAHILNLPASREGEPQDTFGLITDHLVALLSNPDEFLRLVAPLPDSAEQIATTNLTFTNGRIFELYVQPQRIGDHIVGRVWSFHDITRQRQADEAVTAANNKLVLLSTITRHDILNQMTALLFHLELLDKDNRDPGASAHISTMEKILGLIREQLEFTRDYPDLGLKKPEWQDAGTVFTKAAGSFAGRNISFSGEIGHVEIFCDPMFGQVFYNLIDNSLRHGKRVSEIRLSIKKEDSDLLLVYEDNGTGVLPEEKEKIFLKGFGKHTGLGMFLIKEILSITGLAIRENGIYLQGARFEIRVPAGKFRNL
jgi:signal transduction histidine kinase